MVLGREVVVLDGCMWVVESVDLGCSGGGGSPSDAGLSWWSGGGRSGWWLLWAPRCKFRVVDHVVEKHGSGTSDRVSSEYHSSLAVGVG